jgi:enoyl-CoA hydratase/carnithine racemase
VSPSSDQAVLAELDDGLLVLTLNRPDAMNAWSAELEDAYFEQLDTAEADPEVRAVVVTGAGRAFCVGVGMDDLDGLGAEGASVINRPRPRSRPYFFPKPLIAAINGPAAGLGLVEALYCDIRFCSTEAKLTTAFVRRGLIAEYGIAWLLPRLVGAARARDLLFSGRVLLGEEALALGLVDYAVAPEELREVAVAYARDLVANCSSTSIAVMKGQLHRALDGDFPAAFDEAEPLMREALERPDFGEGVASFVERRTPAFGPLDDSAARRPPGSR